MTSYRVMVEPDQNYESGHWNNLAIRKDEKFYIQLQWDAATNRGVIEFRNSHTHNLLGHMPLVIKSIVDSDDQILFKREE